MCFGTTDMHSVNISVGMCLYLSAYLCVCLSVCVGVFSVCKASDRSSVVPQRRLQNV